MTSYSRNEIRMCQDCGHDTYMMGELYMLQFYLWEKATETRYAQMLCIGCVEERLGRRLERSDFINCPLNFELRYTKRQSLRLRSRLRKTQEQGRNENGDTDNEI